MILLYGELKYHYLQRVVGIRLNYDETYLNY